MKQLLASVILISVLGSLGALDCNLNPKTHEARLLKDVFCDYDITHRPVKDVSNVTMVNVKMVVKTFDFVSKNNEVLT